MNDGLLYGELPGAIVKRHMQNIKSRMIEKMSTMGRNASMRSVESLAIEADDMSAKLTGLKSWVAMERGRKGGRVPYAFREIILQWAVAKGIKVKPIPYKTNRPHQYTPQQRGLMSFAGAVAHTIMMEGTSLYRNQGFSDIYSTVVEEELTEMQKELSILAETSVKVMEQQLINFKTK